MESLKKQLQSMGLYACGIVETKDIIFRQDIREMCKVNTCRMYDTTWACPPAIGTVEECRQRLQNYELMLVISGCYQLEDSFDYEGMISGAKQFKESCRKIHDLLQGVSSDYILLANEGCDLCSKCTYPDAPCRFPKRATGSLEGYGIFVSELATQAGIKYNNGTNTLTYFGGLVCNREVLEKI